MITVVNKKYHTPTDLDIYVGRGSPLGNPKPITHLTTREEAIYYYKGYICEKIEKKDLTICQELNRIYRLAKRGDVNLVCFCVPDDCHGNFIKQLIESKL